LALEDRVRANPILTSPAEGIFGKGMARELTRISPQRSISVAFDKVV
jgi:hypothetical protein